MTKREMPRKVHPHPKQVLYLDLGMELEPYDILRRSEMEPSEINPGGHKKGWEAETMMMWATGVMTAVCLIYYIVILLYSGITTSFAFIWLFGSGFFFFVAAGSGDEQLHPKKLPLWFPVSAATLAAASLLIFVL